MKKPITKVGTKEVYMDNGGKYTFFVNQDGDIITRKEAEEFYNNNQI